MTSFEIFRAILHTPDNFKMSVASKLRKVACFSVLAVKTGLADKSLTNPFLITNLIDFVFVFLVVFS